MPKYSFLNRQEYGETYKAGYLAYFHRGTGAINPHMKVDGYDNLREQTMALAWENGWWACAEDMGHDISR